MPTNMSMSSLFAKSPVFGFLDITLPSKYTGGDRHVEFDGRQEVITRAEKSEYDCSCLAWVSKSRPSTDQLLILQVLECRIDQHSHLCGPSTCSSVSP